MRPSRFSCCKASATALRPTAELRPIPDLLSWHNAQLRRDISEDVMKLFRISNLSVLIGVGTIFGVDTALILFGYEKSIDRLVDAKVIMTLIGATAVQLGSIAFLMARSLYSPGNVTRAGRGRRPRQKPAATQNPDDEIV
jgi:hypothetical protein